MVSLGDVEILGTRDLLDGVLLLEGNALFSLESEGSFETILLVGCDDVLGVSDADGR